MAISNSSVFNMTYDDSELRRQLATLAQEKETTVGVQIIASARRICTNLAFQTNPMGKDESAKKVGQDAVERDIKKVYARANDGYDEIKVKDPKAAKAFYGALINGKIDRAVKILQRCGSRWKNVPIAPFDPQLHPEARRGGKVYAKIPKQIVILGQPLDKYIAKMRKRSGIAAAGFAQAADDIGGARGIPAWKKGKKGVTHTLGFATNLTNSKDNPKIILINQVPYIQKQLPQFKVDIAIAREGEVLTDLVKRALDAAIKKAKLNK